jgi:hypothetical protein
MRVEWDSTTRAISRSSSILFSAVMTPRSPSRPGAGLGECHGPAPQRVTRRDDIDHRSDPLDREARVFEPPGHVDADVRLATRDTPPATRHDDIVSDTNSSNARERGITLHVAYEKYSWMTIVPPGRITRARRAIRSRGRRTNASTQRHQAPSATTCRDPNAANGSIHDWGASTASSMTADRLRSYADRVRDSRVRDLALLRVITGYLAVRNANAAQLERARRLADSIALPPVAIKARLAVSAIFVQRGDSARVRAELGSLLVEPALSDGDAGTSVARPLAMYGGLDEVTTWARASAPALRSRRLVLVADALRSSLDARRNWSPLDGLSNGPDSCRDWF